MRFALILFSLALLLASAAHAQSPIPCAPLVLGDIQIKEATAGYDVDVEYPVLCSTVATRTIRDFATGHLSDFKLDFPEHDGTEYPSRHEMIMDYNVWPAAKGRLGSVQLQVMVYTGGAHPNHWPITWVFDMQDGHVITLADIFSDLPTTLTAIAPMVRGVLKASMQDMYVEDMATSGTLPTNNNYSDFILNDEGIVFFFAPYQVGPYAAGQQIVTIPWEQIDEYLSPKLKKLLNESN